MSKATFAYIAASFGALAVIIVITAWIWRAAGRQDAISSRRGLVGQLMEIKTQAMADLRDGLSAADYRQLGGGISRLREVNAAAGWYLSEEQYGEAGSIFRRTLERFSGDVERRDLSAAKRSFEELTDSCVACHQGVLDMPLDEDLTPLLQ
jgi:hypothetical protein